MIDAILEAPEYLFGALWIALGIATTYGMLKLAAWNLRRSRLFKRDN